MKPKKSASKTFLVTGAGGTLGRVLVPYLMRHERQAKIIAVIHQPADEFKRSDRLHMVCGDLKQGRLWSRLPKSVTHIFHLAARIPKTAAEGGDTALIRDNLLPVTHLLAQSAKWPHLKQVIYSSTVSVYGASRGKVTEPMPAFPLNPYAEAKWIGEQMLGSLEARGVRVASLRYSSLYGHGMSSHTVLPKMVEQAVKSGRIRVWGRGRRTQDFLSCEDAARANYLAYRRKAAGTFNISSGRSITMRALAAAVNKVYAGGKSKVIFKVNEKESMSGVRMDISKARRELGYSSAFSIHKGLAWLKRQTNGKAV